MMNEYMFITIIKNFVITILTYYTFAKLLKINKINVIKLLIVSILTTSLYVISKLYINSLFAVILVYFIQIVFIKFVLYNRDEGILTGNLIANSIAYTTFTIATIIESLLRNVFVIYNNIINFIFNYKYIAWPFPVMP